MSDVYQANPIRSRNRATHAEMQERAKFLIDYAARHGPVTVRQLYYRAEVEGLPGIDKTDAGYNKVPSGPLLRRAGKLPYHHIVDFDAGCANRAP